MTASETTVEPTTGEYERLRVSGREVAGNRERATVADVTVGADRVTLVLAFDWTDDRERVTFDLDSEREVLALTSLARSRGYDYDQLPYLEGESVTAVYLDGSWHPAATLPDLEAGALTDAATDVEPGPLTRGYRRFVRRVEAVTGTDVILAVIATKKILVAAAVVYLVVSSV